MTINIIKKYLKSGFSILPVRRDKTPALPKWAQFQTRQPSEKEAERMFTRETFGIGVVCGEVSGGLEALDFDNGAAAYPEWSKKIPPELFKKLVVEKSPHGVHAFFRCPEISRNQKLASGKDSSTLIETRGRGGYCICAPTPGYSPIQGSLCDIQTISPNEREILLNAAREFDQLKAPKKNYDVLSPVEAFNRFGDVRAVLERHGWAFESPGSEGNENWRRPGKNAGVSATLKENENGVLIFYPFSTSTSFQAGRGYNPFQVYTQLEFNGDESAAARSLRNEGVGTFVDRMDKTTKIHVENIAGSDEMEVRRRKESFQDFPVEVLPEKTRDYVTKAARAINANVATVACSILVAAGSTVGARVKLHLGGANWNVAPILWVAIAGGSASGKSPAMKLVRGLLNDKACQFQKEYAEQMGDYKNCESMSTRIKKKIETLKLQKFEAECDNNFDLVQTLRDKIEKMEKSHAVILPKKPTERILEISGAFTLPGLVARAEENQFGFLIRQDELTSLFVSLSNSSEIGASGELLIFKDGASSKTALKTEDLNRSANECWAAILGGIVPKNLRRYILGNERQDDGFLSRFIIILPPLLDPSEFVAEQELTELDMMPMKQILEVLADFRPKFVIVGKDEKIPAPRYVKMGDDARRLFNEKRNKYYAEKYWATNPVEEALLGKSDDTLGRLMLLLHVLDSVEKFLDEGSTAGLEDFLEKNPISADVFQRAERLADWMINETREVYRIAGFVPSNQDLDFIAGRLKELDSGATISEISRWKSRWKSSEGRQDLEQLMVNGVQKGLWSASKRIGANNKVSEVFTAVIN